MFFINSTVAFKGVKVISVRGVMKVSNFKVGSSGLLDWIFDKHPIFLDIIKLFQYIDAAADIANAMMLMTLMMLMLNPRRC
jgi:hypothetical protein